MAVKLLTSNHVPGYKVDEVLGIAKQSRQEALDRPAEQGIAMGADAVISFMFDSTELGPSMDEIIAFGTAVVVTPVTAEQQLVKLS
jgi:uncharacterized protein YbjQ (UPF0145 family)